MIIVNVSEKKKFPAYILYVKGKWLAIPYSYIYFSLKNIFIMSTSNDTFTGWAGVTKGKIKF